MKTPKTISPLQVSLVLPQEVKRGFIIAEGIILDIDRNQGIYIFRTPGCVVFADPTEAVQVYARITEEMAVFAKEAYDVSQKRETVTDG